MGDVFEKCSAWKDFKIAKATGLYPYFRAIQASHGATEVEIDSRPSDALALAVRVSAPIFAAEEVIEESAIEFEHEVEDTEEVVDKFKEFLDEVTPEDFARGEDS